MSTTESAARALPTYVVACRTGWFWDHFPPEARPPGRWVEIREPSELCADRLAELAPRYVFFPHWSHKVDATIFEAHECVVFHATPLPFGRGGSPIQNMIARGHDATELCALRMTEAFDAGPVYARAPLSLLGGGDEIFDRLARTTVELLAQLVAEEPAPTEQRGEPTPFARRKPHESAVEGIASLHALFDHVRMLDAEGYPRAYLDAGPFRLTFSRPALRRGALDADVRITLRDEESE